MEIAGTSPPASGSEHLISHALDNVSAHPQMHGLQVGVASYLCALLQDNPAVLVLRDILNQVGFFDFVAKNPFNKQDFLKALKMAPQIKDGYYTILSEAKSYKRALKFIEKDVILQQLIKD